jgi:hypothetical protein
MLHNVKVFIKETVKKALKPVLLLVIKNPDNLLLRIYSQYLYNSVISGLSKMNLEAGEKLPYSIEKKWNRINKILSYSDPIITVTENKAKIKMRLSHKNIFYYARFPLYDRALPRICREIQKINNELVLIDIGANIGDTAVLVTQPIPGGGGELCALKAMKKSFLF